MSLGYGARKLDDSNITISSLKKEVERFIRERAWEKYHSPKNIAESIVIEASELLEHFQWLTIEESWEYSNKKRVEVAEELADILIYILSMANILKIDLSSSVLFKLKKNREKYPVEKYYGRYYRK